MYSLVVRFRIYGKIAEQCNKDSVVYITVFAKISWTEATWKLEVASSTL